MEKQSELVGTKSVKRLYRKLSADFPEEKRIYTSRLVCFLLIQQQLTGKSAQGIISECVNFDLYKEFSGDCSRKQSGKALSTNSSGYIQAKQSLPKERLFELYEKLFAQVQNTPQRFEGRRVFVVDGTELKLQPEPRLRQKFPPSSNSYGKTYFPLLRVSLIHDAFSALAYAPSWSAGRGEEGRGEVSLALEQISNLEKDSIIIGDRNFGIFSFCHESDKIGLKSIVRLTDVRANKLLKEAGLSDSAGFDLPIEWKISRADIKGNPHYTSDLSFSGRIIKAWVKKEGEQQQLVTLFTTLKEPTAEEIVNLYSLRWNIEHDIRDLKKTCSLDELSSLTVDSVEKELLAGVLAYNLVRAVMLLAANTHGLKARQISFKLAYDLLRTTVGGLLIFSKSAKEQDKYFSQLLLALARSPLPKRKPRKYKRESYKRSITFPMRKPRV